MTRRRAALAGLFAVVYPGLGHVYLREWGRAVAWFGLAVLAAVLVTPASVRQAFDAGGIAGLVEASGNLPLEAVLLLTAIRLLNVLDAVRIALGPAPGRGETDAATCPNCGREVDEDLEFCHWCTSPIDPGSAEAPEDGGLLR